MELGRTIIWLHTFGERCVDPENGRPAQPPRLAKEKAPRIPAAGAIPQDPEAMPDEISYDAGKKRLLVGGGYIENVSPEIWSYDVSGKQVLPQWFSYRKRNREKPPMGDKRPPSELCKIQPESWLAEYTTELLNVLHVLGRLVELEKAQGELLGQNLLGPDDYGGGIAGRRRAHRASRLAEEAGRRREWLTWPFSRRPRT